MPAIERASSHPRMAIGVGATAFLVSAVTPMGYDEAFWVGIGRMVSSGKALYAQALDNKTPLVHLLFHVLDALPGPFWAARAAAVGLLAGFIAWSVADLARRRGPANWVLGLAGGAAAALASQFHLTLELAALALVFLTLRIERPVLAAIVAAVGTGFDLRLVLLAPAIFWWRRRRLVPSGTAAELAYTLIVVLSALLVFANDGLRFGLVELNIASRPSSGFWETRALVALAAVLPIAALSFTVHRMRLNGLALAWAAGSLAIPLISSAPFDHYWVYVVGIIPLVFSADDRPISPLRLALVLVALTPLALNTFISQRPDRSVIADYRAAAQFLAEEAPGESILYFGDRPFLAAFSPNPLTIKAPTTHYLAWETSRSALHRVDFFEELEQTRILALDSSSARTGFEAATSRLTCRVQYQRLDLYLAPEFCH